MVSDIIQKAVVHALRESGREVGAESVLIEIPEFPEHGDFATNAPLKFHDGSSPMDFAEELARVLAMDKELGEVVERIEAKAPGFVNFFLKKTYLRNVAEQILGHPDSWGNSDIGAGKTVIVEYFQLNVAKRPHVGHFQSAVFGDAIKRIFLSQGFKTVSDTHVGDWGTQFGILLFGYKEAIARGERARFEEDPFGALEDLYVSESAKIKQDLERRDRAKEEFAKLERGDEENRKIWQWMVEISMEKLFDAAQMMELIPFEEHRGESAYEETMPGIVERALKKGVAQKKEDGAVVVDLSEVGLDEAVLLKSDGASTYLLRDLATIQYRMEQWNFWKNVYVVDNRQKHHFQQVFEVAKRIGLMSSGTNEHVSYGFLRLPEGVMSTRAGNVVSVSQVIEEARARALRVIDEKNPELQNKENVARIVGLGALKYFILSHHRSSDIVFRWEEALSFEGNTGPYLQYTYARLSSILRKIGDTKGSVLEPMDQLERDIMVRVERFPEVISLALEGYVTNALTQDLFELAQSANAYYETHPVMNAETPELQMHRIGIVGIIRSTLRNGLRLLGIDAPEEM